MKYADFEKAQELMDEISMLQEIATTLAPDEYKDEEPVKISRVSGDHYSVPVTIPADIARELSAMVWRLAEKKEKEFDAL